jgi:CDP-glucose 4,6-dehydratase
MHFLITGHTGFKGTWLTLMLTRLGHQVSGISLPPEKISMFNLLDIAKILNKNFYFDIRDRSKLEKTLDDSSPDVVIHLAAQSLVISGYENPVDTFEINVNGTLNVLTAVAKQKSVKAQLIITTDKVYKNDNRRTGYKETDPLGGSDPYSTSKAMADLLTQSWIASQQTVPTAILRAGNVIGGGDFSDNRLIPDFIRSVQNNSHVKIRYPEAVRPWQHVIDCLDGYLTVLWHLLENKNSEAWNVGPEKEACLTVNQVLEYAGQSFGLQGKTYREISEQKNDLTEKEVLILEVEKIRKELGWRNKLKVTEAFALTLDWYKVFLQDSNVIEFTNKQIDEYYKINK